MIGKIKYKFTDEDLEFGLNQDKKNIFDKLNEIIDTVNEQELLLSGAQDIIGDLIDRLNEQEKKIDFIMKNTTQDDVSYDLEKPYVKVRTLKDLYEE